MEELKLAKVFQLNLEELEGEEKQICEGLWKIFNYPNPEITKRLDIDDETSAKLRGLITNYLKPFTTEIEPKKD